MEIKTRKSWTTSKPGGANLTDANKLLGVSIHYPGSGNEKLLDLTEAQVIRRLQGWRNYHMNERDWADIGYQIAFDGSGRVWILRGIDRVPAASASINNPDANEEWGAFLLIIGDNEVPNGKMLAALEEFYYKEWLKKWPRAVTLKGHGDVPGASTLCPGPWVTQAIRNKTLFPGKVDDMASIEPTTILGTDTDGSPFTMAEFVSRFHYLYGQFVDSDGTDSILTRVARIEQAVANLGSATK